MVEMFLLTSAEGVVEDGVAVGAGGGAVGSDVEAKTGEDIADLIFHLMLILNCVTALNDCRVSSPACMVR